MRPCESAPPQRTRLPFLLENEPADVTLRDKAEHSTSSHVVVVPVHLLALDTCHLYNTMVTSL